MEEINEIAKRNNLKVIIDGAQSFGATYKQEMEVHQCDLYTTSFFPAKPLGCYGDGGAIFTNNEEYAEAIKIMRVHGQNKRYNHKYIGMGGRLDTIQAAVLLAKLPYYPSEIVMRQEIAEKYTSLLSSIVSTPDVKPERTSVWAQYTIRVNDRDQMRQKLEQQEIPTAVHYPIPLHLQECFQYLECQDVGYPVAEKVSKEVISLPMNPYLKSQEQEIIFEAICKALD